MAFLVSIRERHSPGTPNAPAGGPDCSFGRSPVHSGAQWDVLGRYYGATKPFMDSMINVWGQKAKAYDSGANKKFKALDQTPLDQVPPPTLVSCAHPPSTGATCTLRHTQLLW